MQFGRDNPSELLDPGVWLWYADVCIRQVPSETADLDERSLRAGRHALATALAATDEALKFIPAHADRVPLSAFTSADGLAMHEREPGRFTRSRLEAVRATYATSLAHW